MENRPRVQAGVIYSVLYGICTKNRRKTTNYSYVVVNVAGVLDEPTSMLISVTKKRWDVRGRRGDTEKALVSKARLVQKATKAKTSSVSSSVGKHKRQKQTVKKKGKVELIIPYTRYIHRVYNPNRGRLTTPL